MIARGLALALALACGASPAFADEAATQDRRDPIAMVIPADGEMQALTLRDGSRLFGRVMAVEPDRIVFRTAAGVDLSVLRADIATLRVVEGEFRHGEFVPADPNATRLFFAPTGRSLKRGQGYLGVYEFLLPFVQIGLTDRISIGAGTPLVFGGGGDRPFWFTPKAQLYDGPRAKVAVGLLHLTAPGGHVGIAYGVATLGTVDRAATVGLGYTYEASAGGSMVVMLGGERRVHRRIKLITENYLWPRAGVLSGGVRFIGDGLSADLGLVAPLGGGDLVAFPVVNFVWVF